MYVAPIAMNIQTVAELEEAINAGQYTELGGYPTYFVTADGAVLSHDAVKEQIEQIKEAITEEDTRGGWRVMGVEINFEDPDLFCEHTNKRIPSAYAEPEEVEE